MAKKLVVEFEVEKATKNTIRFSETGASVVADDGTVQTAMAPMVNTQYVQQWALSQVTGDLASLVGLRVTIEAIGPEAQP